MPVPRIGRILDLGAAALVVGGAATYARAYLGLERLRASPAVEYTKGMAIEQMAHFHALERLSRVGVGLGITGIAIGVAAAIIARRLSRAG